MSGFLRFLPLILTFRSFHLVFVFFFPSIPGGDWEGGGELVDTKNFIPAIYIPRSYFVKSQSRSMTNEQYLSNAHSNTRDLFFTRTIFSFPFLFRIFYLSLFFYYPSFFSFYLSIYRYHARNISPLRIISSSSSSPSPSPTLPPPSPPILTYPIPRTIDE